MSENQFERILTDETQKEIVEDLVSIISEKTSIRRMVIKGFLWRAMREWQKEHKMTILDTETGSGSTTQERIKQTTEILGKCKDKMRHLVEDDPNAFETLESSFKDALNHYIEHYSKRKAIYP